MLKNPTTHTLYSHSRRKQIIAVNNILNLRRFLFLDKDASKAILQQKMQQNIAPYLVPVVLTNSPLQTQINHLKQNTTLNPVLKQKKIQVKQMLLDQYIKRYAQAVEMYKIHRDKLQQLVDSNNVYLAHEVKQDQYLYIIDTETSRHLCLANNAAEDCQRSFSNKHDIQLEGMQTDAVRVQRNNLRLDDLHICDQRDYMDIAHRDAIQLIPPAIYKKIKVANRSYYAKSADQMAGTILENITISHCKIIAPKAALQGIFSSDGLCRNLKITDTTIETKGAHSISVAGALTGCEMKNITLRQAKGGSVPEITLYPLRIGGNMADDGVIYIFSFSSTSELHYGEIKTANNKRYRWNQSQAENIEIEDKRHKIPSQYQRIAFGLHNFNYPKYMQEYQQWTIADFKQKLPQQFAKMEAWIDLRISEYSSGRRLEQQNNPLPLPSREQMNPKKHGVLDMLIQAQNIINNNSADFNNTRLPEIQETAIRSFSMKCIALRNGDIQALYDLGENMNAMRKASLHFLLAESDFTRLVKKSDSELESKSEPALIVINKPIVSGAEAFIKSSPHIITRSNIQVKQGKDLILELDTIYENVSYFWLFGDYHSTQRQISKTDTLTLHTKDLLISQHQRVRVTISDRKRQQKHLSYYFDVIS